MSKLYNVSSSPHVRSKLTTGNVMYNVALSLVPAALVGVYNFGFRAFLIIAVAVLTAVAAEYVFDRIVKKPNTIKDCSAVVTGLLLALCLPGGVPLFVPFLGSLFAIIVVKCLFGGLGYNFMNPALAGRCFLLISFSGIVANYSVEIDGMSSATPLMEMTAGESVKLADIFIGNTNGVIGCSILALLIGGLYLLFTGGITIEIPAATIISFAAVMALFGGEGFDLVFILKHICAGGIVMGAFFMATDPVTSPVTSIGQIIFGALVGILSGVFRLFGTSADSVSYAIIIANMVTPLIDTYVIPVPYGRRNQNKEKVRIPKSAVILCVITLIAGVGLSGVFKMTEKNIREQEIAAKAASYQEVLAEAVTFGSEENMTAAIEALAGGVYGDSFGKVYINEAIAGTDADGNVVGYVIGVTSAEGFKGNITLSVGMTADGTVTGIAFTELNETAGLGMVCAEDSFKGQYAGVKTDGFIVKKGDASAENEINAVTGATVSSTAVTNAVNAAINFFAANVQ